MVRAQVGDGRGIARSRMGLIAIGLLFINTITDLGLLHPVLVCILALGGTTAALHAVFRKNNLRNLTGSPSGLPM